MAEGGRGSSGVPVLVLGDEGTGTSGLGRRDSAVIGGRGNSAVPGPSARGRGNSAVTDVLARSNSAVADVPARVNSAVDARLLGPMPDRGPAISRELRGASGARRSDLLRQRPPDPRRASRQPAALVDPLHRSSPTTTCTRWAMRHMMHTTAHDRRILSPRSGDPQLQTARALAPPRGLSRTVATGANRWHRGSQTRSAAKHQAVATRASPVSVDDRGPSPKPERATAPRLLPDRPSTSAIADIIAGRAPS
jgi:hypothetical protein